MLFRSALAELPILVDGDGHDGIVRADDARLDHARRQA